MANFFIYTGLGILLLGSVFGIYVGFVGMRSRQRDDPARQNIPIRFQFGPVSPRVKKLVTIWRVIVVIGFAITGIGLVMGLNQG